jgi:predicted amidohydrolase
VPESIRVAAIQMTSGDNKQRNIDQALTLIERAAGLGASLAVLPETWTYFGEPSGVADAAESIPGPTIERLADAARKHRIRLHCGSIFEVAPGESRVYNTTVVLDADGTIVSRYRKIHLFDVAVEDGVLSQESATVAPGNEVVVSDLGDVRLGLTICYDLRFPELYRLLALDGAGMIAVPAAFHQYTGKDHWEILLRARAIEDQVFVVAAAEFGKHPGGWVSYGRSMIIDPWGTVLATAPDGAGIAIADCDLEALARIRQELPSLANRRPESYRWADERATIA